ncbi:MAG: hypothetical protein JXR61_01100 [Prolixibacteraceae bacterium]|nr:hypothetical protein [Prolixibacteraceae bacterium]
MIIHELYNFPKNKFNAKGINTETGQFFLELIEEFERDFHTKHPTCYANHLFANSSTMILFNQSLDAEEDENCGMDLINAQIDVDANLAIEEHSEIKTIYAIGSKIEQNEDEPIFLVVNDKISNGTIVLKYIPDDDLEETEIPEPVVTELIKERL